MTKIIIDIFMYLFEFMLFWNYSNTLFEPKKNTKIRLFLMLLTMRKIVGCCGSGAGIILLLSRGFIRSECLTWIR